jgi:hypothetical protein
MSSPFSRALAVALALGLSAPAALPQSGGGGSYVRIDRPERERSFFRDGAAAWLGRRVHVHLPQSAIEKAEPERGGALTFRWKSVHFRVPASSPALARYNRRAPRGAVLCVKGVVRRAKGGEQPYLLVEDFRVGPLERW